MTSLNEKLRALRDTFAVLDGVTVRHYYRTKQTPPVLLWAETGESGSIEGDNRKAEQTVAGDLDYFTKLEFDPAIDRIQTMLNDAAVSWKLEGVDYEEDTNLIHYHWTWEV